MPETAPVAALGPAASLPLPAPLPPPSASAALQRVGFLHIPPLSNTGSGSGSGSSSSISSGFSSVGNLVSLTAALVSGRDPALLEVRSADQGPVVAAVVDFARAAVLSAPQQPLPHLLAQLQPWLLGGT
jgi:hypothetical protein